MIWLFLCLCSLHNLVPIIATMNLTINSFLINQKAPYGNFSANLMSLGNLFNNFFVNFLNPFFRLNLGLSPVLKLIFKKCWLSYLQTCQTFLIASVLKAIYQLFKIKYYNNFVTLTQSVTLKNP